MSKQTVPRNLYIHVEVWRLWLEITVPAFLLLRSLMIWHRASSRMLVTETHSPGSVGRSLALEERGYPDQSVISVLSRGRCRKEGEHADIVNWIDEYLFIESPHGEILALECGPKGWFSSRYLTPRHVCHIAIYSLVDRRLLCGTRKTYP